MIKVNHNILCYTDNYVHLARQYLYICMHVLIYKMDSVYSVCITVYLCMCVCEREGGRRGVGGWETIWCI